MACNSLTNFLAYVLSFLDNIPTGSLCGGDKIGDTDEVREHAGITWIFLQM